MSNVSSNIQNQNQNQNSQFCKVLNCRFASTHVTIGHKCGRCGLFGHGVLECNYQEEKNKLNKFHDDILPENLWCTICPSCVLNRKFHTNVAHNCFKCHRRHAESECTIQTLDFYQDQFINEPDIIDFSLSKMQLYPRDNIYTKLYSGMGSLLFVRKKEGDILSFFMHSDRWGQYGAQHDDTPIMNRFIEDCIEIEKVNFIKSNNNVKTIINCPICRTENDKSEIKQIFGLEEKCKICFEENITKFFSQCGHAVCCNECIKSL